MKVKELIEDLNKCDPEAEIVMGMFYFGGERGSYNCEAKGNLSSVSQFESKQGNKFVKLYCDSSNYCDD